MTGWLLNQTYGFTSPPEGAVLIQRDDEMDVFEGDLEAAVAYAESIGGTAHAIMMDPETMAPLSDAWVLPGGPGGLVKHSLSEATAQGWYGD